MLAMLSNRRGGQKENKRLDAMNDGVPMMTSFAQATSNKKNITCLKCGKKEATMPTNVPRQPQLWLQHRL
jgi:hypothetical protein